MPDTGTTSKRMELWFPVNAATGQRFAGALPRRALPIPIYIAIPSGQTSNIADRG